MTDESDRDILAVVQSVLADVVTHDPGSRAEIFAPASQILDLGVNSIQLLQIHAHIETRLGIEFSKAALFDCETIADLAEHLSQIPGATR
jgi:acyl carrier protein